MRFLFIDTASDICSAEICDTLKHSQIKLPGFFSKNIDFDIELFAKFINDYISENVISRPEKVDIDIWLLIVPDSLYDNGNKENLFKKLNTENIKKIFIDEHIENAIQILSRDACKKAAVENYARTSAEGDYYLFDINDKGITATPYHCQNGESIVNEKNISKIPLKSPFYVDILIDKLKGLNLKKETNWSAEHFEDILEKLNALQPKDVTESDIIKQTGNDSLPIFFGAINSFLIGKPHAKLFTVGKLAYLFKELIVAKIGVSNDLIESFDSVIGGKDIIYAGAAEIANRIYCKIKPINGKEVVLLAPFHFRHPCETFTEFPIALQDTCTYEELSKFKFVVNGVKYVIPMENVDTENSSIGPYVKENDEFVLKIENSDSLKLKIDCGIVKNVSLCYDNASIKLKKEKSDGCTCS